jgi:hypothetical protein
MRSGGQICASVPRPERLSYQSRNTFFRAEQFNDSDPSSCGARRQMDGSRLYVFEKVLKSISPLEDNYRDRFLAVRIMVSRWAG